MRLAFGLVFIQTSFLVLNDYESVVTSKLRMVSIVVWTLLEVPSGACLAPNALFPLPAFLVS